MQNKKDGTATGNFLGLALLVSSPMALAAPAEPLETIKVTGERTSSYLAEEIESGTKLGLSVKETPQSISVITEAQIDDFGMVDINDVLNSATGVFVQQVETDRTTYTARGFDIVNFQLDGLGLPLAYGTAHGHTDTAVFERVEVVRGASGLMAGVGNPSATINIVRKRPTEALQAYVTGTVGTWDFKRLEGDVAGPISEGVRGRLVVAKEQKESYLQGYALDKSVLYGVIEADLGANTVLTLGHTAQQNEADGNLWGALPLFYADGTPTDFDVSASTAADWSYWDFTDHSSFLELKHTFGDDWFLLANYQHNTHKEDSNLFYYWGTPNPDTGVGASGYASKYTLDEWQDFFDVYASGTFSLGGLDHEVVMGASWAMYDQLGRSLYDADPARGFPALPPVDQWTGNFTQPVFDANERGADIVDEQVSAYATARIALTPQLKTIVGGRWDNWQSEGESYGVALDRENSNLTPYLGLTYAFADSGLVYASYTEIFSPQSETGQSGERLDPVEGAAYELGVKQGLFEGRLLGTLALFEIKQQNLAVALPGLDELGQVRYQEADAGSRGVELELVGEVSEGLQLSLGYTKLDVDSAPGSDGNHELYTPEQMLRLATVYRLPALPKLKLGGNVSWQDDISRNQGVVEAGFTNEGEPIVTRQDAYALVNLMASYEFSENFKATVNAENVTDEKYINSLYWAQGFYGAPRHGKLSLTWSL